MVAAPWDDVRNSREQSLTKTTGSTASGKFAIRGLAKSLVGRVAVHPVPRPGVPVADSESLRVSCALESPDHALRHHATAQVLMQPARRVGRGQHRDGDDDMAAPDDLSGDQDLHIAAQEFQVEADLSLHEPGARIELGSQLDGLPRETSWRRYRIPGSSPAAVPPAAVLLAATAGWSRPARRRRAIRFSGQDDCGRGRRSVEAGRCPGFIGTFR